MTVCACSMKTKSMAADSRVSGGVMYRASKIRRIGESLFSAAGDWASCHRFFLWLETDRKEKPEVGDEAAFDGVELSPAGIFQYTNAFIRMPMNDKFYAIGTGAQGAMVAMKLGHSPKKAVQLVAEYDESVGPPFIEMFLNANPKTK